MEGPVNKDITFMVSARRMYLDFIMLFIPETKDSPKYYFYDLNAKINYKFSENDKLFLSGYFGRDVFSGSPEDNSFNLYWGNATGNLRWMHIISPNLFTNFSLIYSDYTFDNGIERKNLSMDNFNSLSQITDLTARGEAQYFPDEKHTIKTGFEAVNHQFRAFAAANFTNESKMNLSNIEKLRSFDLGFYLQDEWKISPLLNTNIGGRFSYFERGNYFNFEPRLSASYVLKDNITIKGAFAIANQYLHLLSRNDITLPTDVWFPSGENIKPSKSIQGSIGIETNLRNDEYLISLETYYKETQNVYDYQDSALLSFGMPLESQLTTGKTKSYGLELFINKRLGALTGWIGYTLSWTKNYFNELNNGNPFYPRHDKRHDISIALTYKFSESLELGASWVYSTGQAYTLPTGVYGLNKIGGGMNGIIDIKNISTGYSFTERNGYRLPPSHRLDLNLMYNFNWFDLPFQLSVNVYNAYNHMNPFLWYFDTEYDSNTKTNKKVIKQITLFPFIPTLGLSFKF